MKLRVKYKRQLEQLRKERKNIYSLIKDLGEGITVDCSRGSPRREIVRQLLSYCIDPDRHSINPLLLRACVELLSYQDRIAVGLLQSAADEDYLREIKKVKSLMKVRHA